MAFRAKDGSDHTNLDSAKRADAKHAARAPQPAAAEPDGDEAAYGPPPIEQDPEAMQAVQVLQQKGYTPEEVAQAMQPQEQSMGMMGGQ